MVYALRYRTFLTKGVKTSSYVRILSGGVFTKGIEWNEIKLEILQYCYRRDSHVHAGIHPTACRSVCSMTRTDHRR